MKVDHVRQCVTLPIKHAHAHNTAMRFLSTRDFSSPLDWFREYSDI